MRLTALVLALAALPPLAAETLKVGQFEAQLAEENAWLPSSIRWVKGGVELLHPEAGLNLSFTSFENRTKIYREENRNAWKGKAEPRFLTDAKALGKEPCAEGAYSGVRVRVESSYAIHERRLLFHASEPRLKVVYALEFTRDAVLHEASMLGVGLRLADGFDRLTVPDAREAGAPPISAPTGKGPSLSAGFQHAGPRLFANAAAKAALLVLEAHSGAGLERPPANLLALKKGQKVEFTVEARVGPEGDPALADAFREAAAKAPAADRPFALVADAQALERLGRLPEAEAALREAARLAPDLATPWAALAALCRDHKLPGEAEAWLEAGYRMPYNYGYMLSGSGLFADPRLTEEQRRQHLFNLLIAVENTAFYPDYYLWAARGFLKMEMKAQACAMYRQALWAADRMPRPEEFREKLREECRKKIAELEASLGQTCTNLPPLLPVRLAPAK